MAPRPIPKVEDFVSFADLDPASPGRIYTCIYHFSDANRRCRIAPSRTDSTNAQYFRNQINQSQDISLKSLQQYALANCCKAHHQSKLQDCSLLEPLARRWQTELRHAREAAASHQNSENATGLVSDGDSAGAATVTGRRATQLPRYNLRSRTMTEHSGPLSAIPLDDSIVPRFRPHVASPKHTVASKLLKPSTPRDSKPGILYLFNRLSSPGLVKIGLTTVSVQARFNEIQRDCGYRPQLIQSFNDVPHIYRVEMLVHFELVEHWRVEKRCEVCNRQHKEWFEIDANRAVEVARQWAEWMTLAEPYDSDGLLRPFWRLRIQHLEAEGRSVTARTLLDMHRALQTVTQDTTETRIATRTSTSISEFEQDASSSPSNVLSGDNSQINTIAQAILSLSIHEQRQLSQAIELVRRSSWSVTTGVSRASTFVSGPERLERQGTGISIMSLA